MTPPIPVSAIEAVRLTCKHCGVAVIMPMETKEVPAKCFNCCYEFPAQSLREFMREFRYLKEAVGKADVTFVEHLEQADKESPQLR